MPERWRPLAGALAGLVCLLLWWRWAEPGVPGGLWWPGVALAAGVSLAAVGLQVLRTAWLFDDLAPRAVARPVLWGHGLNTLVALAGDATELAWLVRHSGQGPAALARRLVLRTGGSAAALGLLIGCGLLGPALWWGLLVGALGLVALLWQRRGEGPLVRGALQLGLAVPHVGLETLAVLAAGQAVGAPVPPGVAMVGRAGVELATWLPVPLGGAGVHHVALSAGGAMAPGQISAEAVVLHHLITVLVGMIALGLGLGLRSQGAGEPDHAAVGGPLDHPVAPVGE